MKDKYFRHLKKLQPRGIQTTIMAAFSVISISIMLVLGVVLYMRFSTIYGEETVQSTRKLMEQTGENPPACVPGKRCLLLAPAEKPQQYAALCLVETDSLGRIRSLKLSRDPRYDFEPEM